MGSVIETIELQTHREWTTLRLSNVEKFRDGGYECRLAVRSGGFSCDNHFSFDDAHLTSAIASMRRMIEGHPDEALLKGEWETDFMRFAMNKLGHVVVSGELYEHSELPQSMKFSFRTDQTVLALLVRDFTALHEA